MGWRKKSPAAGKRQGEGHLHKTDLRIVLAPPPKSKHAQHRRLTS